MNNFLGKTHLLNVTVGAVYS